MGLHLKSFITSDLFGWIVRGLQYAFTIINVGLGANNISIIHHSENPISFSISIIYFISLSISTSAYLAILAILCHSCSRHIITGSIIIVDSIFAALWLGAFVPVGVEYGDMDCSYYNSKFYVRMSLCGTLKASFVFGLLNFLIFLLIIIIFGLTVIRPLVVAKVDIWSAIRKSKYQLNGPLLSLKGCDSFNVKEKDFETGYTTNKH